MENRTSKVTIGYSFGVEFGQEREKAKAAAPKKR
jgi:hypothetical protein